MTLFGGFFLMREVWAGNLGLFIHSVSLQDVLMLTLCSKNDLAESRVWTINLLRIKPLR